MRTYFVIRGVRPQKNQSAVTDLAAAHAPQAAKRCRAAEKRDELAAPEGICHLIPPGAHGRMKFTKRIQLELDPQKYTSGLPHRVRTPSRRQH